MEVRKKGRNHARKTGASDLEKRVATTGRGQKTSQAARLPSGKPRRDAGEKGTGISPALHARKS